MENAVINDIHAVFPADVYGEEDSISLKNLKKQEAQWNLEKEVLGFQFGGIKNIIWLVSEKPDALLLTLSNFIRSANKGQEQDPIGAIGFK